ncbi:MAG: AMP-binding protein, partial [Candidatus Sumerlaeales bacterium]|nr:AMP-binding protein [Candidatus Sumerlaeales bacterium]
MTDYKNLVSHLYSVSKKHADVVALVDGHSNPPVSMTYQQVCDEADRLALCYIKLGIKRGDRVALFADNQPLWRLTDYALLTIGAISVPRGTDSAIAELWYIIQHSEARIAILQDINLAKRLFDAGHSDALESVVLLSSSNSQNVDISQINLGACKLYFYDDI